MDRSVIAGIVVCAFILSTGLVLVGDAAFTPGADVSQQQEQPDADYTGTHIAVHADGSATWTVRIRTNLEANGAVGDFEAFQTRFRDNRSRYLDSFRDGINDTVQQAATATGRDMVARNFSASTSIETVPRQWGVVTYTFTWTSFASRNSGRLAVGDVFQGGFFIAENDTLTISPPAGYEIADASPEPRQLDNDTARWVGRRTFTDGRPEIVFRSTDGQSTQPSGPGNGDEGFVESLPLVDSLASLLVLVVILVLIAVGSVVTYRRDSGSVGTDEPVSDRQRVRDLLQSNDGQLKQSEIVAAFDWSKSKTSRVLSSMADEDAIEKLQIGRENVIRLPDEGDDEDAN